MKAGINGVEMKKSLGRRQQGMEKVMSCTHPVQTVNMKPWRCRRLTHTPRNGPFSGTTRVSRYQKGKTNLDFTEARDSEWQWHQQGYTQVCT